MANMGGMAGLLDKLPGMGQMPDAVKAQVDDKEMRKLIAIINSMTPQERRFPAIIKGSRKRRIAAGSRYPGAGGQQAAEAVHPDAEDDEEDEGRRHGEDDARHEEASYRVVSRWWDAARRRFAILTIGFRMNLRRSACWAASCPMVLPLPLTPARS